ncbi:LIM domain-containing protein A-like [Physella acuta]|uniref:LIM domain-containing protein A-like n=1 Tax=Physella acuta TaxID=109671 RepID=UPI0027DBF9C1|nr:LIM domain-containing protein A-like [Physella acuta]
MKLCSILLLVMVVLLAIDADDKVKPQKVIPKKNAKPPKHKVTSTQAPVKDKDSSDESKDENFKPAKVKKEKDKNDAKLKQSVILTTATPQGVSSNDTVTPVPKGNSTVTQISDGNSTVTTLSEGNATVTLTTVNTTSDGNVTDHKSMLHNMSISFDGTSENKTGQEAVCAPNAKDKMELLAKDVSAMWGYIQAIKQPINLHVHNEDGHIQVDHQHKCHSECKGEEMMKGDPRKPKDGDGRKNKDMDRPAEDGKYRHGHEGSKIHSTRLQHGRHRHHSHHTHHHNSSTHEHTHHKHSHHDHSMHDHIHHSKHNHSDHNHTRHSHKHDHIRHSHKHDHTRHSHKHDHTRHSHKHDHTRHSHKHDHTRHSHKHFSGLDLSKLGHQSGTHVHIHIHVEPRPQPNQQVENFVKSNETHIHQMEKPLFARCDVRTSPNFNLTGSIFLRQQPGQNMEVVVNIKGFPVAEQNKTLDNQTLSDGRNNEGLTLTQKHGIHVHEFGDFSQGCASFGGHFNPFGHSHGGRNGEEHGHVGDWGNIEVNKNGDVNSTFTVAAASLFGDNSIIGRGIVIHAKEDDLGLGHSEASRTTGDAGGRIGCCVVAWMRPT